MPFVDRTAGSDARGGLAEGLAHDVITRLAKLRVMFVIAHGSVFALSDRNVGPEEAGRMLNVDYIASGSVQRRGDRIVVASELVETRSARIIWTDTFEYSRDRCVDRARRHRQQHRCGDRARDRSDGTQSRDPAPAELVGRVGGLSSRPLAHVSIQPERQRPREPFPANVDAPRPDVLARVCGAVVHAFSKRVPAPNRRSRGRDRSRVRRRGPEHHRRRSGSGLALGDGSRAVAARSARRFAGRTRTVRAFEPELRAGPLRARLRELPIR